MQKFFFIIIYHCKKKKKRTLNIRKKTCKKFKDRLHFLKIFHKLKKSSDVFKHVPFSVKIKTCHTHWKKNSSSQTLIQTIASIHSRVYTGWGRGRHLVGWCVVLGALRNLTTSGVIGVSHKFAGGGNVSIGGASVTDKYKSQYKKSKN